MRKEIVTFRMLKKIFPIILLFLLIIPVFLPLTKPGFFVSDDGEWMIIRFSAFHQALRDGQWPVRWLDRLNHEYGYPVANFLYPGFMYLAEIPKIVGFGFVDSIKIVIGFSLASSALFVYLWLRKLFSQLSSLLGAIFYLYAPYHLWDVYKRGSVGEVLALSAIPFILWTVEKKNFFFSSLGIGWLILSHNTLAILFLPVIMFYAFLRKILNTKYLILNTILGLGLAAFFWIPAIFDLGYTKFFEIQVANWQEHFADFGLIGLSTILIIILVIILQFNKSIHRTKLWWFFLVTGGIAIFLSLSISKSVWQFLPANFIQFPFRPLSIVILSGSYLVGLLINQLDKKRKWIVTIFLSGAILLSAVPYIKPTSFDKGEGFYATNEDTTTVKNEYLGKWVKNAPLFRPLEKIEIISGKGETQILSQNSRQMIFLTKNSDLIIIKVNKMYFPGWYAKIDDQEQTINFDNSEGIMTMVIPSGEHRVEIYWKETPIRKLSDFISLLSLTVLITFSLRQKKKNA